MHVNEELEFLIKFTKTDQGVRGVFGLGVSSGLGGGMGSGWMCTKN